MEETGAHCPGKGRGWERQRAGTAHRRPCATVCSDLDETEGMGRWWRALTRAARFWFRIRKKWKYAGDEWIEHMLSSLDSYWKEGDETE